MSFLLGWNLISFRFHHPEEVVYRICFFLFQGRRSQDIFMIHKVRLLFASGMSILGQRLQGYMVTTWIGTSMQVSWWASTHMEAVWCELYQVYGDLVFQLWLDPLLLVKSWGDFQKEPYKVVLRWDLGNGHPSANSTMEDHGALILYVCEVLWRVAKYSTYIKNFFLYIIRSPINVGSMNR